MTQPLTDIYAVKFASIAHDGDPAQQTIVAAASEKTIVVLSYVLANGGVTDGTVKWQSNDTDLSGAMELQADGGSIISSGHHPRGCLKTASGEALKITTSGIAVAGHITYVTF